VQRAALVPLPLSSIHISVAASPLSLPLMRSALRLARASASLAVRVHLDGPCGAARVARPPPLAPKLTPNARPRSTSAITMASAPGGDGVTPSPSDVLVVYVTVPDAAVADAVANAVINPRLAACVNVLPGVTSVYRWQGAVQRDVESLLIIKTVRSRLDALTAAVKAVHPYDTPEVLALPAVGGSAEYLKWVVDETAAGG